MEAAYDCLAPDPGGSLRASGTPVGIYIQKIVGGYFASANPPHIQGNWRTPDAYSRDEVINALLQRGAHKTDIGDAFYAADQEWLGSGGDKAAG